MHRKGSVYYYVTSRDGKRKWERLSDVYSEALAIWAQKEGAHQNGETVADAIDHYIVEIAPQKARRTQEEYQRQAGRLRIAWRDFRLDEVRPVHIAEYLDSHEHKVTANREAALLSSIFSHAMRRGWCDSNPCKGVRRHSEKPRKRYLADWELERLRKASNDQFRYIIDLAYLTAMRKGDLLRISLPDIREDGLYVQQTKTGKRQVFDMEPELRALIGEIRSLRRRVGSMSLFCTRTGQPYTVSGFDSNWRRIVQRSELEDVHFHDIRAKALTDAKRDGGLDYAQALAGHESRNTTESYVKARDVERVRPLNRKL